MTTRQLILMTCLYLAALVVVTYVTRATTRRIAGALAGGAVVGLVALGVVTIGEAQGWWRVPFTQTPYVLLLGYLGFAISCTPIYLITWRVARRFSWRGLAVFFGAATIIGPIRDYRFAAAFPEWIIFAPGVAPVLAVGATYAVIVALGHAVMRLVAGPACEDLLARRFWKSV